MFGFLKEWRKKRAAKKKRKEMVKTSRVFGYLEQLFESNMLMWNARERRLYIAEPLAVVFIGQGWERWRNFLNNAYLYMVWKLQNEKWEEHARELEQAAIRERKAQVVVLPKAEADRIRRAVRAGLVPGSVQVPPIEPFEFFVIADRTDDALHEAIAFVGEYDPDTRKLEMVAWEEVKDAVANIQQKEG